MQYVCIYCVKVRFCGSGTLKIVILVVENHPQKRSFKLADYHPSEGRECELADTGGHNRHSLC